MGKINGLFNISGNFNYNIAEPSDSRMRVQYYSDLTNANTFGLYAYKGMLVVVFEDSDAEKNGLYLLKDLPSTNASNWVKVSGGSGGDLEPRLLVLENTLFKIEMFDIVNSTTGTITLPANSTLITDKYTTGAAVSALNNNLPTYEKVLNSSNDIVTATLNSTGNYTLSSTPSNFPVALIYQVSIKLKDLNTININKIINGSAFNFTYSGTSDIEVGGIPANFTFNNVTLSEFINKLIKKELFPTLTPPDVTFNSTTPTLQEVNSIIPSITFIANFNRGSINPQYTASSPYRSGLPNLYEFTGTGLTNETTTDLTVTKTVNSYQVILGTQTWTCKVNYDAGVQPKSNWNNDYDSPLPAGSTTVKSFVIKGVYPFFATTVNITTETKQNLQEHGTTIQLDLVAENGTNKQKFVIPTIWGTLSKIEQYNTLSGKWDIISISSFTKTTEDRNINGVNVSYDIYTHNGSTIGERSIRLTF